MHCATNEIQPVCHPPLSFRRRFLSPFSSPFSPPLPKRRRCHLFPSPPSLVPQHVGVKLHQLQAMAHRHVGPPTCGAQGPIQGSFCGSVECTGCFIKECKTRPMQQLLCGCVSWVFCGCFVGVVCECFVGVLLAEDGSMGCAWACAPHHNHYHPPTLSSITHTHTPPHPPHVPYQSQKRHPLLLPQAQHVCPVSSGVKPPHLGCEVSQTHLLEGSKQVGVTWVGERAGAAWGGGGGGGGGEGGIATWEQELGGGLPNMFVVLISTTMWPVQCAHTTRCLPNTPRHLHTHTPVYAVFPVA